MKVKGTMLLSPVISFKCLSKGQIVLVIKKEVFIKIVMQLPRGWLCRHGSWMSGESTRAQWVPPFPDSLMYSLMLSFTDFFSHTSIQSLLPLFVWFIQYALVRLLWLVCWSGKQAPSLGDSVMHILRLKLLTVKKPADFQSVRTLWEWRLLPASNWNEDQDCEPRGKVWAHVINRLAPLSHPREAIHWRNVNKLKSTRVYHLVSHLTMRI